MPPFQRQVMGLRHRIIGVSLDEAAELLGRGDPNRRVQVDVRWYAGRRPRVKIRADRGRPADVLLVIEPQAHEPGLTRNGPRGNVVIRNTAAGAAGQLGIA